MKHIKIQITKDEFYKRIYSEKLNVNPHIVNQYSYEHKGRGYIQEWVLLNDNNKVWGITESGNFPFTEPKYYIVVDDMLK
jgi:hypothetical protein